MLGQVCGFSRIAWSLPECLPVWLVYPLVGQGRMWYEARNQEPVPGLELFSEEINQADEQKLVVVGQDMYQIAGVEMAVRESV